MRCARCGTEAPVGVVRVRRRITLALFVLVVVAGWLVVDPALRDVADGYAGARPDMRWLVVPFFLLLAAAGAWTLHLRRALCPQCGAGAPWRPLSADRGERLLALA